MTLDEFLISATPKAWCEMAAQNIPTLLIDHAHCEKKAASTAINLLYRYPQHTALMYRLSRFAREELRHFEKVLQLMQARGITLIHLSPCRYAGSLHKHIAQHEPLRLIDTLLISALIEARSCERFRALVPYLDDRLAKFYGGLLAAEQRHFTAYLEMAHDFAELYSVDIAPRMECVRKAEAELIQTPDERFRFHSGVPTDSLVTADID